MRRKTSHICTSGSKPIYRHTHTETTLELDSLLMFHRAVADSPRPPALLLPPVFYYSCGRETDHNSWSQQKAADWEMEGGKWREDSHRKEKKREHFGEGGSQVIVESPQLKMSSEVIFSKKLKMQICVVICWLAAARVCFIGHQRQVELSEHTLNNILYNHATERKEKGVSGRGGQNWREKTVIHSYLNSCVISVKHWGASLSFDTEPQGF